MLGKGVLPLSVNYEDAGSPSRRKRSRSAPCPSVHASSCTVMHRTERRLQEICNLSSSDSLLRSRYSPVGMFHSSCVQLLTTHGARCIVVVHCHANRTVAHRAIPQRKSSHRRSATTGSFMRQFPYGDVASTTGRCGPATSYSLTCRGADLGGKCWLRTQSSHMRVLG